MKDQNKNQKAPETKLTDEQLGEVNAGMAQGMAIGNTMQACGKCAADEKPTINISIGQAKSLLQAII